MKINPKAARASTSVAGLVPWPACILVWASAPPGRLSPATLGGLASNSTVTWAGPETCPRTCPGATSTNSSCRLAGFSTRPVTRQARPSACQTPPGRRLNRAATWLVIAAWPGPEG